MVEWLQMRLVVLAALGTLVLVWWVALAGSGFSELDAGERIAVQDQIPSGKIVVNPVVRSPRLETSVFAPVSPCQIDHYCLE